jgi:hypothetical protein
VRRYLVTDSVVPISPILVTVMMQALRSFETSVLTRATRRNIPEEDIFHSHHCKNLKSYNILSVFFSRRFLSSGLLQCIIWGRIGCAVAQAVSNRLSYRDSPCSISGEVLCALWWTERHWGRFSPNTPVSLATHSFHQLLKYHHHVSSRAGKIGR